MQRKHFAGWLAIGLAAAFALSAYLGYQIAGEPMPQEKPLTQMTSGEPEKPEIVFLQGYQVCINHDLDCLQPMEAPDDIDLSQATLEDIQQRYPEPHWLVRQNGTKTEVIEQQEGLCSVHQKIMHLGVNASGEFLTVYKGPAEVGSDGGVLQVTDIAIEQLPAKDQQAVREGTLEIYSEEELIGLLDGLSNN